MKTQFRLLILTLFAGFFISFAFAGAEPITLTLPQSPYLVGHPNPALEDVNCLYITVILRREHNEPDLSFTSQIEQKARALLGDSDINVIGTTVDANSSLATLAKKRLGSVSNLRLRPANVPEFRIEVDLLNLPDADKYVFRIQTSFVKKSMLEKGPQANMTAEVWKDEPVMCAVASKDLSESVIAAVIGQTKTFIGSWSEARQAGKKSDDNHARTQLSKANREKETNSVRQKAAESKYVASKNSDVFHKPDCPFAQNISPKNIIDYNSPEEAIAAGKRPCKKCNP
ncbi:MAG: hypothetical protein JW749_09370 [Sedimentisphaerales bacterium]|nr:hypothetical protein [Sedimentisphaerales bacterium]